MGIIFMYMITRYCQIILKLIDGISDENMGWLHKQRICHALRQVNISDIIYIYI